MITRSPAIVLKAIDYGDSSKILTVFSRNDGKIALIAHSAKKPKSKFAGLTEAGNILEVVYYHKKTRSVQILKEASFEEKTFELRQDFEKMAVSLSGLELIKQLLHENEVNKPLFDFTQKFLLWLNETDVRPERIFPYLQLRLIELMGLGLQLKADTDFKNSFYLNIESGTVEPASASSRSYKLSANQFRYISKALRSRNSAVFELSFRNGELKELITYLDRYLYFHVEGLRERKSDAVFEQILSD